MYYAIFPLLNTSILLREMLLN